MKDIVLTGRRQKKELFTLFIYALTLIPRLLYNMLKKKAHTEVKN